jgi:carbonic anhydrase
LFALFPFLVVTKIKLKGFFVTQNNKINSAGCHGCRGVAAAIENHPFDVLSSWLRLVARLASKYKFLLEQIAHASSCLDAPCVLNVIEQVHTASRATVMQEAWRNGRKLTGSGLIYDRQDRLLEGLQFRIGGNDSLATEHRWR